MIATIWRKSCILALALAAAASPALAKPHDIRVDLDAEYLHAIHAPTGCVAKMEFQGGDFVGASLIDPLCLPEGARERAIPAQVTDFYRLRPSEIRLIGR